MNMSGSVTACAEGNQILFDIISEPAARAEVVDMEVLRCAAVLAAPPIAREHLPGELAIRLGLKPQSRRLPFGSVQGRSSQCPAIAVSEPREEHR